MSNQSQNSDDYERQMAQRRKQNRIVLVGIGVVLLVLLAFSQIQNAWIFVLGTLIVVGGLLYARSIVERRYKAAAARQAQKLEEQHDVPKE